MNHFSLKKVSSVLGPKWGLANLNLELDSGQCAFVLGPNGSGKSTALRMMAGLYPIDKGEMTLQVGEIGISARKWKQHVSLLPETFHFPPKQTILESLRYFSLLKGASSATIDQEIHTYFSNWKLESFLGYNTNECSMGVLQMVKISHVLMHRNPLIILDEPMESLDPRSQRAVWKQIRSALDEGVMCVISLFAGWSDLVRPSQVLKIKSGRSVTSSDCEKALKEYEEDMAHSES